MSDDDIDEYGRPNPPSAGSEVDTLLGFLDYQRATLDWKCRGLDIAGLSATVGVSTLTLGGMLTHMAFVEDHWFSFWLNKVDREPPWRGVDWSADQDWDWHFAAGKPLGELQAFWQSAIARSRVHVADALAEGGMERLAIRSGQDGMSPSLRWIVVHMIEEYARHNGHADLIREAVDGETGE